MLCSFFGIVSLPCTDVMCLLPAESCSFNMSEDCLFHAFLWKCHLTSRIPTAKSRIDQVDLKTESLEIWQKSLGRKASKTCAFEEMRLVLKQVCISLNYWVEMASNQREFTKPTRAVKAGFCKSAWSTKTRIHTAVWWPTGNHNFPQPPVDLTKTRLSFFLKS